MATSTLGNGTLVLAGTTSGTTTVTATAVAGTTTLTLPAATDTLVGRATTDTLSNKTLTGAAMNGTLGATTPSTVAATSISASTTLGVTGVATFSAGTAAAPAITTTGDTNTGIFFPAADTIAFAEGGAEVARFDSAGNFGLGVTPSAWQVNNRAIQLLEGYASISSNNSQGCCDVAFNCFNAGSAATSGWKYTNTGVAVSLFQQQAGAFKFLTAASGTAGNAITFTQAMTLNANGALALLGASTSANGVGITFPATQSASTDANTLDDYEEGTWTPNLLFNISSTGMTFAGSGRVGTYTRIGRLVYCTLWIQLTAKGSSTGNAVITGLPFTPVNIASAYSATVSPHWFNMNTISVFGGYIPANDPTLYLSGGVPPNNASTSLTDANFNNTSYFMMNFSFQAA